MEDRADALIVGGGVIGTSIAFHLAQLGLTDVLLLERSHLAAGSTGRSVGMIETAYATEVNVALARRGYDELSRFPEITGETADFHHRLYLETVAKPDQVAHLERTVEVSNRLGLHTQTITTDEISKWFPELRTDDVAGGLLSEESGFCDPHSVAKGYASAAERLGVRVRVKAPVERVLADHGQVRGVRTADGDVRADVVVNAAGPWANDLNRDLGFEVPLARWQRQIFVTTPHPKIPNDRPLYIDMSGRFYFRQELDGGFVLGLVEDHPAEPGDFGNPETDWEFKTKAVAAAVHRVPRLEETQIASGWSGVVTFTPDQLPVLGPVKEAKGFYLANGMSGYGVMISPGVGLVLAEMIVQGESRTIDASPLAYDRFAGKQASDGAGLWFIED